jgi:HSP20 family protein
MFFAPTLRNHRATPALGLLDGAFERFMSDSVAGLRAPGHGLEEDDKAWTLSLDIPGVAKEHLRLHVDEQLLRIETSEESKRRFQAAWQLPQEVDAERCEARLENGVLTVKLAKLQRPSNARQIAIE